MKSEILNRKGARKAQGILGEVITLLNRGKIETVNLTEWLSIDHIQLIKEVFPEIGINSQAITKIINEIEHQKKASTMQVIKLVGTLLFYTSKDNTDLRTRYLNLSSHNSDSIRCYAPYLIAMNTNLGIAEKLHKAEDLICDDHFGVREVIWMALRPEISLDLKKSIELLGEMAKHSNDYARRFASEVIRPRGVWCKHIEALKEQPEMALPVLEPLKADKSKYVQDSVGNWLNDASKSKPEFVIGLCDQWKKSSPTKETERIIKKARRTIDKK